MRLFEVFNYQRVFPARLRAFLFDAELASTGYFGFGFFSIIKLLSPDRPCDFFFYVDLASPGDLVFGGYSIINFPFFVFYRI